MRNGKPDLVVCNVDYQRVYLAQWVSDLLGGLRPGGKWIIPRTVSTVLVLSKDPPIAQAHSIFPDPHLVETLRLAGWIVQTRDSKTN